MQMKQLCHYHIYRERDIFYSDDCTGQVRKGQERSEDPQKGLQRLTFWLVGHNGFLNVTEGQSWNYMDEE